MEPSLSEDNGGTPVQRTLRVVLLRHMTPQQREEMLEMRKLAVSSSHANVKTLREKMTTIAKTLQNTQDDTKKLEQAQAVMNRTVDQYQDWLLATTEAEMGNAEMNELQDARNAQSESYRLEQAQAVLNLNAPAPAASRATFMFASAPAVALNPAPAAARPTFAFASAPEAPSTPFQGTPVQRIPRSVLLRHMTPQQREQIMALDARELTVKETVITARQTMINTLQKANDMLETDKEEFTAFANEMKELQELQDGGHA